MYEGDPNQNYSQCHIENLKLQSPMIRQDINGETGTTTQPQNLQATICHVYNMCRSKERAEFQTIAKQ